jgi:hypothetical protein
VGESPRNKFAAAFIAMKNDTLRYELIFHEAGELQAQQHEDSIGSFDDFGRQQYDKLWRINVLHVVVSFLFRIAIRWINAHGIWCLVAVR